MNSPTRPKRRSPAKRRVFFWRQCAGMMLLVLVWDICFDVVAPLHADRDTSAPGVTVADTSGTDPESHPPCGFPDHSCSVSHHHHFPALVSTTQFLIAAVASSGAEGAAQVKAVHIPQASRHIRAPPVEA